MNSQRKTTSKSMEGVRFKGDSSMNEYFAKKLKAIEYWNGKASTEEKLELIVRGIEEWSEYKVIAFKKNALRRKELEEKLIYSSLFDLSLLLCSTFRFDIVTNEDSSFIPKR
jgi:hypothetical protein